MNQAGKLECFLLWLSWVVAWLADGEKDFLLPCFVGVTKTNEVLKYGEKKVALRKKQNSKVWRCLRVFATRCDGGQLRSARCCGLLLRSSLRFPICRDHCRNAVLF